MALYHVDRSGEWPYGQSHATGQLRWEVQSEDFVYAVSLSDDMEYVAFGGTARAILICKSRSKILSRGNAFRGATQKQL